MNEGNNRIAHWDNIKFVMITLMVIGHFADDMVNYSDVCKSIYLFMYAFHMPVLLFISGLFYTTKNLKKRVLYYISGGFAVKIFLSAVYLITNRQTSFTLLGDAGISWFFFVLAIYQIIMYLLRDVNKPYLLAAGIILACFVGYDKSIGDFLYLSRVIVFFPFFLLGYILTPEKAQCLVKKYKKALAPFAVLFLTGWFFLSFFRLDSFYIYRHLFTGRNPFSDAIISYGPLARLLCYLITLLTGTSVIVLIPQIKIPFFTSLGAHSENVYFWHWGLYLLMAKYLHIKDLFMMSQGGKICFLILAIAVSIVVSAVELFNFPLRTIKKYCFKTDFGTK